MPTSLSPSVGVIWVATALCLFFNVFYTVGHTLVPWTLKPQVYKEYSYVGEDYPEFWPLMSQLQKVSLTVEETVHYPLRGEYARKEWYTTSPNGAGYIRMGVDRRVLVPSMFHQMHCLRLIQHALDVLDPSPTYSLRHIQHCVNYLRQMVLCNPDLTLEPADQETVANHFSVGVSGMTHTCQDWEAVYTAVEENFQAQHWPYYVATSSMAHNLTQL